MIKENYFVLIVDDEKEYQSVVSLILNDAGYKTSTCSSGEEALVFLKKNNVDLVITDLRMPQMGGVELIRKIKEEEYDIDILVVTAYGSIEGAVDIIKLGAVDYFVKSRDLDELIVKVDRIAQLKRFRRKSEILIEKQNSETIFLESKNKNYLQMLDMCERTASTSINILLLGESGVGKEVIANHIHRISDREKEPFVPVNCQVYPEGVIESELFGHEKGAFTGATSVRIGKFEEANYGTLFLDEIGDLPMMTQGKLLRVLETKTIERLGSNKNINLDIRYIFATNKDISANILRNQFREDLFYRINTLTLTIPPLRDRKEDLPGLIDFFINKTKVDQKKTEVKVEENVRNFLVNYDYPGNVRELKNIVERMIALSKDGLVTMEELMTPNHSLLRGDIYDGNPLELRKARGMFEKDYIEKVLISTNWNVESTAKLLGITSRQLWNKMSQYEIRKSRKENN